MGFVNFIWKKKIKNPGKYIEKKLKILSKIYSFKYKNQEFTIFLTNNKKMKNLIESGSRIYVKKFLKYENENQKFTI